MVIYTVYKRHIFPVLLGFSEAQINVYFWERDKRLYAKQKGGGGGGIVIRGAIRGAHRN